MRKHILGSLQWSLLFLVVTVMTLGGAPAVQANDLIYDSWNADGTYSNPSVDTVFTLAGTTTISEINNYHWNSGAGDDAGLANGWIGIDRMLGDGQSEVVGRWPAVSKDGCCGVRNAFWHAYPNVTLSAGTYRVVDSNKATWSYTISNYYGPGYGCGANWEPYKGFSKIWAAARVVATVTATEPVDGANGVSRVSPISITFSENIVPGAAWDGITVTCLQDAREGTVAQVVPVLRSLEGNVLVLTPAKPFKNKSVITVNVPAGSLNDAGGYPAAGYQFSFRARQIDAGSGND